MRVFAVVSLFGGLLFVSCSEPARADVFRCVIDGKTSYSDKPCATGATKVHTVDEAPAQRFVPVLQHEANMGRVAVGQTPAQVEQAWGEPKERRIATVDAVETEEWVYERGSGQASVRFRRGVVSSVTLPSGGAKAQDNSEKGAPATAARDASALRSASPRVDKR